MQCMNLAHYAGAIMHMIDVDLLSHDVCQNRVLDAESNINIAQNVICGKARNDNNMCQADIGSPLACYDGNGAYHIAGIYSQDTGCLPTNQVSIIYYCQLRQFFFIAFTSCCIMIICHMRINFKS